MELTLKGLSFGKAVAKAAESSAADEIGAYYAEQVQAYRSINDDMAHGGSVVFGGDQMLSFPFDEMCSNAAMDSVINRSFSGMKAADAASLIKNTVLTLYPDNILLCIGEADIEDGAAAETTAASFAKLMAYLKKNAGGTRVTAMSVHTVSQKEECEKYNDLIRKISEQYGCEFADVSSAYESENPEARIFPLIGRFLRNGINFSQAMYLGAM